MEGTEEMTTEVRANGTIRIHLRPSTPIEGIALAELVAAAAKGTQVTLTVQDGDTVLGLAGEGA